MKYIYIIIFVILLILIIRVKKRKYFWKDRYGNHLTFKQFRRKFVEGVEGIKPHHQTRTVLISLFPVFGGIIWGIVISLMGGTYWLSLILAGSLPITIIQFVNNWQKYRMQKRADNSMKEALKNLKKLKVKKKKGSKK